MFSLYHYGLLSVVRWAKIVILSIQNEIDGISITPEATLQKNCFPELISIYFHKMSSICVCCLFFYTQKHYNICFIVVKRFSIRLFVICATHRLHSCRPPSAAACGCCAHVGVSGAVASVPSGSTVSWLALLKVLLVLMSMLMVVKQK